MDVKLCTIVGARPQFIKTAAVSRIIALTAGLDEVIVHTGQHYDVNMSAQFFTELNIHEPAYHLNIGSFSHGKQTGMMLTEIENVLLQEKPDWVLVYGDTNSTLAGALAAAKLHIPIAHVEAGLRSFNRKMPEEINRVMADHLSTLLFAPTANAYQQLIKEGISADNIINIGDVMYDATLYYNEYNSRRVTIVDSLKLVKQSYVLVTIHRAENTDCETRLRNIVTALTAYSKTNNIIFPVHPRTRTALERFDMFETLNQHIQMIEPVGFLDMLALEQYAKGIITDSGGVQKEAYFNHVPCITLRDETEWVELVDAGWNQLCSPEYPFSLFDYEMTKCEIKRHNDFYGDGKASEKIIEALMNDKTIPATFS
jgi:UDP-GlcNAc3NAcA epimerase